MGGGGRGGGGGGGGGGQLLQVLTFACLCFAVAVGSDRLENPPPPPTHMKNSLSLPLPPTAAGSSVTVRVKCENTEGNFDLKKKKVTFFYGQYLEHTPTKFVITCGGKGHWKKRILVLQDGSSTPIGEWMDWNQFQKPPKNDRGAAAGAQVSDRSSGRQANVLGYPLAPRRLSIWREGELEVEDWEWGWPVPNEAVKLQKLWPALETSFLRKPTSAETSKLLERAHAEQEAMVQIAKDFDGCFPVGSGGDVDMNGQTSASVAPAFAPGLKQPKTTTGLSCSIALNVNIETTASPSANIQGALLGGKVSLKEQAGLTSVPVKTEATAQAAVLAPFEA